jgi:hypothetical protein
LKNSIKVTTEICKGLIVQYCLEHKEEIKKEFDPLLTDEQFSQSLSEKNWKRESKSKYNNVWERSFDCRPFDSQLRAYVTTNFDDTEIISVGVCGE